ncbi:MAG: C40 family peptidase [Thiolinea sp.]
MVTKSLKVMLIGCGGLLVLPLSGCVSSGAERPAVQVQRAVATGNTYIIQPAGVRTPGSDRLRQAQHQQAFASAVKPAATNNMSRMKAGQQTEKQQQQRQAEAARVLREQELLRAKYHARYQAKQQAAEQQKKAAAITAAQNAQQAQKQRQQQAAEKRRIELARRQAAEKKATQPAAPARTAPPVNHVAKPVNSGGSEKSKGRDFYLARWERQQEEKRLEAKKAEQKVERVIYNASKQIGEKYVWGGASPKTGFDCSGLVQHSLKQGANVQVPRTAAEQYRVAVKVPEPQAGRGDLVFFKTRGNSVSHVGIYLGDGKFVHAPRAGQKVTTSSISGYWKQRLVGFGRIPGACRVPV